LNTLNLPAKVTGVEFRKDLVDLCNDIAKNSLFKQLEFMEGSIEQYENPTIDILIALHACDTATDDAIFKGINAHADLIVVAPCCHKQIRKEIQKHKTKNELDFLLKHGIKCDAQRSIVIDNQSFITIKVLQLLCFTIYRHALFNKLLEGGYIWNIF
jgi:hypothetical protein